MVHVDRVRVRSRPDDDRYSYVRACLEQEGLRGHRDSIRTSFLLLAWTWRLEPGAGARGGVARMIDDDDGAGRPARQSASFLPSVDGEGRTRSSSSPMPSTSTGPRSPCASATAAAPPARAVSSLLSLTCLLFLLGPGLAGPLSLNGLVPNY
jgi:hypothetical protein